MALMATTVLAGNPALAADVVILAGTTDNSQKTVGGTDTVTLEETAVLSVDDTAVRWNGTSTDLRIDNAGTIESVESGGRAINAGGNVTAPRTLTLENRSTGLIQSEGDAFRINTDITGGTVHVINAGKIVSTVDGQAIDFDAVSSTPAGAITIVNLAGGEIRSTDADALRAGQGAVVDNAGLIYAGKVANESSDAIDCQDHNGTVFNQAGGTISGARHGVTGNQDFSVVNYGTIIGRNGSGIGGDTSATVVNYGRITGDYDGSGNGDGDGVDLDGGGFVENYGVIEALGFAGVKPNGRGSGSDGVTIGGAGGTVINHAGATIFSVLNAVPMAAGTVINDGMIDGGILGVGLVEGAGKLINWGTISSGVDAVITADFNDEVTNSGLIQSRSGAVAISLGGGADRLTLLPGSVLVGSVDGGSGFDEVALSGDGSGMFAGAVNFERLNVTSGNWTLTAPAIYSEGVSVSAAARMIGDASTLVFDITNDGAVEFAQAADGVYADVVSGTGALIKSGDGRLTLTGANTYTGGTTVAGGRLIGDTVSLQGDIADNATIEFAQGTGGTYAGAVSGTGALVKSGEGSLTLTGANTYTGGTTITAGRLIGNTVSLQGDIADNATLEFAQAIDGTYAGVVSGTGALVKSGEGNLTLTGANTYTGGTTITAGRLIGDTVSLQGDIANNATLEFAQATDGTYAGVVSGTGALVKSGDGSLTLAGANTYTGGTTITGGRLIGDTVSLQGDIANNATLEFVQARNGSYRSVISGAGALIKSGGGSLQLTGLNSFTGSTNVTAGTLLVSGRLTGPVVVSSGAQVGGVGQIGTLTLAAGAVVSPGENGVGTLHIAGDLVQRAGSIYRTDFAENGSPSLAITGRAVLEDGATLALANAGTQSIGARYTLLTADGGISGAYTTEPSGDGLREIRVIQSGNSLVAQIARTGTSLRNTAASSNEASVANAIASLGYGNGIYSSLTLNPDDVAVQAALRALTGEVHASLRTAVTSDVLNVEDNLFGRIGQLENRASGIWGGFTANHGDDRRRNGAADGDRDTFGGITGADVALGANAHIGIAGGYTRTRLNLDGSDARGRVRNIHLLSYGEVDINRVVLRGTWGYTCSRLSTRRTIDVVGITGRDRAHYRGQALHGAVEIGYRMPLGRGNLTPFARATAVRMHTAGFGEEGGETALVGASRTSTAKFTQVGARLSLALGDAVQLGGSLGWQHGFGTLASRARLRFDSGDLFEVSGTSLSRDAVMPSLALSWLVSPGLSVGAGYSGTYGKRQNDSSGRLTLSIGF
jgi:autotransporter-associated beta strand protein